MAKKNEDPTIDSGSDETVAGTEGVHATVPVSEADNASVNQQHADAPEKPDATTIAQVEVTEEA